MNVFDLSAKLTLDKSKYEDGLNGAKSEASSFGTGLASSMAVAVTAITAVVAVVAKIGEAFMDAVDEVSSYGDSIDKMSQKLGMSTDAYQKWDYVMQISGTSMSECAVGMKTLTNKIDDAKNGSTDALEKFQKLGISLTDLQTKSREDIFSQVITGFQNMSESTDRASLANDLFGKSGQNLTPLFNTSTAQTRELMKATEDYGMIMSNDAVKASANYQDSLTTLRSTIDGLKNNIISQFLPSLTKINTGLTKIFSGHNEQEGVKEFEQGLNEFVAKAGEIVPIIITKGADIIVALCNGISSALPEITPAVAEIIRTFTDVLLANMDVIIECAILLTTAFVTGFVKAMTNDMNSQTGLLTDAINNPLKIVASTIPVVGIPLFMNNVSKIFGAIKALINGEQNATLTDFENLAKAIGNSFAVIPDLMRGFFNKAVSLYSNFRDNLPDTPVKAIANKIGEAFSSIPTKLGGYFTNAYGKFTSFVSGFSLTGIENKAKGVADAFSNVANNIGNHLSNAYSKFTSFVSGFSLSGIENKAKGIGDAFSNVASNVGTHLSNAYGKFTSFVTGFSLSGIEDKAKGIGNAFSGIASTIGGYIADAVRAVAKMPTDLVSVIKSIGDSVNSIVKAFSSLGTDIGKYATEAINTFWRNLTSSFSSILREVDQFISNVKKSFSMTFSVSTSTNTRGSSLQSTSLSSSNVATASISENAGVTYNQTININREVATADELAKAIRTESRYGLMTGGLALG